MPIKKALTLNKAIVPAVILLTVSYLTGCQNIDGKRAFLYKKEKDQSSNDRYERPSLSFAGSQNYYGGNVVFVPDETIVTIAPTLINIGWLKNPYWNGFSDKRLPAGRIFPEKSLWLVVNIEGFAPEDFLRTSSKRSFLASSVKLDQLSNSLLALDQSEMKFNIKTSDYKQHEVTFTLYQVDDFKLKQLIGTIKKENEGLIKIGVEAGSAMVTKILGTVADPLFDTIKGIQRRYGDQFLFERLLLSSGATKEFDGMIYLVTSPEMARDKKPSQNLTTGSKNEDLLLLDPTSLLAERKVTAPGKLGDLAQYNTIYAAISQGFTASDLKQYKDYMALSLNYTVDNNAKDIRISAAYQDLAIRESNRDAKVQQTVSKFYSNLQGILKRFGALLDRTSNLISYGDLTDLKFQAMYQYAISQTDDTRLALLKAMGAEILGAEREQQLIAAKEKAPAVYNEYLKKWSIEFRDIVQKYDVARDPDVVTISNRPAFKPEPSAQTLNDYIRALSEAIKNLDEKINSLSKTQGVASVDDAQKLIKSSNDLITELTISDPNIRGTITRMIQDGHRSGTTVDYSAIGASIKLIEELKNQISNSIELPKSDSRGQSK